MNKIHNRTRRFFAFILGAVFYVGGVLKLMDPVGTGLIVEEYCKFFHLGFLGVLSVPMGVALGLLESFSGVALMSGVFRSLAAIVSGVLLVVFSVITLILWIFNPEMDCGCFGEAIHLTHFQSFAKNVILLLLGVIAFLPPHDFGKPSRGKYLAFGLVGAGVVFFTIYSLLHIPLVDFTPFRASSLLSAAADSDGAGEDYIATLIYEKNGQEGTFSLDKLPDSTWTFVRTDTFKKQDVRHNRSFPVLSFTDHEGNYCDSLASRGTVMVISAYKPQVLTADRWMRIDKILSDASATGFTSLLLVSGIPSDLFEELTPELRSSLSERCYVSDYKTLISLNRSNGGLTYFNEGNLIQKWAFNYTPNRKALEKLFFRDSIETMLTAGARSSIVFQAFLLYSFAVVLLF